MRRTQEKLETVSALARTIGNLTADEYPVWYSIYANELQAAVRDARESLINESAYVAELIKASLGATNTRQYDEILMLVKITLEEDKKDVDTIANKG